MKAKNENIKLLARIGRIQKVPEHYARLQNLLNELDPDGAPDAALPTELPKIAPERWSERKDKGESVPEFVERVWGPWIRAELLTLGSLRPLDSGLRPAIYKYCRITGTDPASILPTRWKRGDGQEALRLLQAGDREGALQRATINTLATYAANSRKDSSGDW